LGKFLSVYGYKFLSYTIKTKSILSKIGFSDAFENYKILWTSNSKWIAHFSKFYVFCQNSNFKLIKKITEDSYIIIKTCTRYIINCTVDNYTAKIIINYYDFFTICMNIFDFSVIIIICNITLRFY